MNICFASSFRRFSWLLIVLASWQKHLRRTSILRWLKESQYTIYLAITCFLAELILEISADSHNNFIKCMWAYWILSACLFRCTFLPFSTCFVFFCISLLALPLQNKTYWVVYTADVKFLTVQEMGTSKIRVQQSLVSKKSSFPGLQTAAFLLCAHTAFLGVWVWRENNSLVFPLIRALIPEWVYHLHDPIQPSQRLHVQIPLHWELELQHVKCGGHTNIQSMTPRKLIYTDHTKAFLATG